jgi:hypothetical protein
MQAHLPQVSHEAEHVARVAISVAALIALLFAAALTVTAIALFNTRSHGVESPREARAVARPRLESSTVRTELFSAPGAGQLLQERQREQLSRFAWVDQQHGLLRIPIDVAMDLELSEQR